MFKKHRSLSSYTIVLFALTLITSHAVSAQSDNVKEDLNKELKKYSLVRLDPAESRQQADQSRKINLNADGRSFELTLTPRDLRSNRYHAEETGANGNRNIAPGSVNTFKGKVSGDDASSVRMFMDGSRVEGFFFTRGDKFYVEPASHFSRSADPANVVIYKAEDIQNPFHINCQNHVQQKIENGKAFANGAGANIVPEVLTLRVVEIATDADFEFVSASGGSVAANADILNSLNMVEGVYENELGLVFSVTFQHTWATGDPFGSTGIEGVMRQFQFYWNTNYPSTSAQYARDTAHLFTNKSYARGQGWALIDVVCNRPNDSYGVTGLIEWVPAKYMLTAHEIGHNLGATHVEAGQSCANTLMNSQLSTETPFTFCQTSRSHIEAHINDTIKGACLSTRTSAPTRLDFDGDGKSDMGLFRPSTGVWFILNSANSAFSIFQFGQAGDKPVAEDYDGDGKTDAAVYRNGGWFRLKSSTGTVDGIGFGTDGDIPAAADYNGDGKADVAVYRPSEGRWYIFPTGSSNFEVRQFGIAEDIPVPADYDGDGLDDVNVFRPSTGTWFRINSRDGSFSALQFGSPGDRPQVGDFDGDGRADQTIYRPASGSWYVFFSTTNNFGGIGFGADGDVPVPADFDGDGKTDFAVFRPGNGNWYKLQSQDNGFYVYQLGTGGDMPAHAR